MGPETLIAMGAVVVFFGFFAMFLRGKRFGVVTIGMIVVGLALIVGGIYWMNPCLVLRGAC